MADDVDLYQLAKDLPGLSGALPPDNGGVCPASQLLLLPDAQPCVGQNACQLAEDLSSETAGHKRRVCTSGLAAARAPLGLSAADLWRAPL